MTELKWKNLLEIMKDNDEYTEIIVRKLDLSHGYYSSKRPLQNLVENLKYDNVDLTDTDILEAVMKDLIQILENRKNQDREGYILRTISLLINNYHDLLNENLFVKLLKLQNFVDFEEIVSKKKGDYCLAIIIVDALTINKKFAFLKNKRNEFLLLNFMKNWNYKNTFENSRNFMKFKILGTILDCCSDENFYDLDFFEQIYTDIVSNFESFYDIEEYLDFQRNDRDLTIYPNQNIFLLIKLAQTLTKTFLDQNFEKYKGDYENNNPSRILKAISYITQREQKIIELKLDFKEKSIKNDSNQIDYQLSQIKEIEKYLEKVDEDVGYE